MMQKIQKFGGAMFTPVLLFSFAGIMVGISTLFTTELIMGSLAAKDSLWYLCWNVVLQGGWTMFRQIPLVFVASLPIGLANKQNARACMEALVGFLTFLYFENTILTQWGPQLGVDMSIEAGSGTGLANVASLKVLDMNMLGALLISGIIIAIHNKFFDFELPDWLGIFRGSVFVYAVSFFVLIPTAVICCFAWPHVQAGMTVFQGFMASAGLPGIFVFVFLERILIPFGLHHFIYMPFFYDNAVVNGGIYDNWSAMLPELAAYSGSPADLAPFARFTCTGWSKIFGCSGIALAFYYTAKPSKKVETAALLVPVSLTAIVCGITEPIEFTFLFMAPALFAVHAVLAACLATTMNAFGVVGIFDSGLIKVFSFNAPVFATHIGMVLTALAIGLCFTALYFVVFTFLIKKFDFKTPGREDDDEEVSLKSKKDYQAKKASEKAAKETGQSKNAILAENILDLLGGAENIADVTNCATRLRVNVKDETLVATDKDFKSIGTSGVIKAGKSAQVIVGLSVPMVRDEFERLL